MNDFINSVPDNYKWAVMTSPFYGVVCLGLITKNRIDDIRAEVERLPSGDWYWRIRESPFYGVEFTKQWAIKRVEFLIKEFSTRTKQEIVN